MDSIPNAQPPAASAGSPSLVGRSAVFVWDTLAVLLVVLPFFTGGFVGKTRWGFIELSDLGPPVLIVGLLGLALRGFGIDVSESSAVLRAARKAFGAWSRQLERRPVTSLLAGSFIVGTIWSFATVRQHWAFHTRTFDLGIYFNVIWNFANGKGYWCSLIMEDNLMQDHQSPSFLLLAPLIRLFPHGETLLIVQGLGIAMGGLAVYFLARQWTSARSWLVAAAPLLYWSYLPFRNSNAFEFHPEVPNVPAFIGAIVGLQSASRRARVVGVLLMLYSLGLKETAGPVFAALGAAWILGAGPPETRRFTRIMGGVCVALGCAVFYFDMHVVPKLFGISHYYASEYSDFGSGIWQVALAPILMPGKVLAHCFGPRQLNYLFWCFGPLGFLPLLNPVAAIAALPGFLLVFLSNVTHRLWIGYHYTVFPAIGLWFAFPRAAVRAEARFGVKAVALWLLFWALGTHGRSEIYRIRDNPITAHDRWLHHVLLPAIDPDVTLSTTEGLTPHLAARHRVYELPKTRDRDGAPIPCLVIDDRIFHSRMGSTDEVENDAKKLGYETIYRCPGVRVMRWPLPGPVSGEREGSGRQCLRSAELPPCLPD